MSGLGGPCSPVRKSPCGREPVSPGVRILTGAALELGEPFRARFVAVVPLPAPSASGRSAEGGGALPSPPPPSPSRGEECATSCSPLASAAPRSEELGERGDKGCSWDG
ncbi:hypothetical protein J1605_022661 [Eschrichtius robustus]|uniref:Uncharacterized protein n=1 Tax=Eschrichtius robustus TaxID=9764 RepID=A0AB34HAN9_ESCRO|nr:hypothetical protein J1605_022661 [Eschrichtius robustus]